jgi:hypothetical protein
MYSPKIASNLIPEIYRAARTRKMPMTTLVNEAIADYLARLRDADHDLAPLSLPRAPGCDDTPPAAPADRVGRPSGSRAACGTRG